MSHSATVSLILISDGRRISLSHTAADYVITRDPVEIPAGNAIVEVTVDGESHARRVRVGATRGRVVGIDISSE